MPACLARFVGDARGDAPGVVRALAGAFLLAPGFDSGVVRSTTPTPIDRNAVARVPSSQRAPKRASSRILRRAVLGGGNPRRLERRRRAPREHLQGRGDRAIGGGHRADIRGSRGRRRERRGLLAFRRKPPWMCARELGAASASFLGVTNPRMDRWSAARLGDAARRGPRRPRGARASASFAGVLAEPPRSNRATSSGSAARASSARTARRGLGGRSTPGPFRFAGGRRRRRALGSAVLGSLRRGVGEIGRGLVRTRRRPRSLRDLVRLRTPPGAATRARAATARARAGPRRPPRAGTARAPRPPPAPAIFLIAVAANCAAPGAARDRSHSSSSGSSFSRTRGSGIWQYKSISLPSSGTSGRARAPARRETETRPPPPPATLASRTRRRRAATPPRTPR